MDNNNNTNDKKKKNSIQVKIWANKVTQIAIDFLLWYLLKDTTLDPALTIIIVILFAETVNAADWHFKK